MHITCTSNEICNYLRNLKDTLSLESSKLKVIKDRDKNYCFAYLYSITDSVIRDVLLSLSENEFYDKVESTNANFKGHYLYIWNPIRTFVNLRGVESEIELYVKTDLILDKKMVVVVSFHPFNEYD